MRYYRKSLKRYIEELRAGTPVPGGGSAAALSGALGTALLEMVCNFTLGNARYKKYERRVKKISKEISGARKVFAFAVDEDVRVYLLIRKAFLKNASGKNKEAAIKNGYYISEKICRLSKNTLESAYRLIDCSNQHLISDIGCGAEMAYAAFNSARYNAYINLNFISDSFFVKKEKLNISELSREASILYRKVSNRLKKRMEA